MDAILTLSILLSSPAGAAAAADPALRAELIFPLHPQHNHAPGIVELPGGDILVSWYRGSGERGADDVAVYGARLTRGESRWSDSFLLADTPGFPDCNTAMHLGADGRLWLFWPTIIANSWESCITNYRISRDFQESGAPRWEWQGVILLEPLRFQEKMRAEIVAQTERANALGERGRALIEGMRKLVEEKLSRRLGWQPRCKPTVLPSGRLLLPLYSDTYSVSVMAMSDDGGKTWQASEPLAGFGAIQPSVLRRRDGTLVAFLRENGPLDKVRVAESKDDGVTWGPVGVTDLPNPGSGLDGLVLQSGRWLLIHNDTTSGRQSLAATVSEDEGRTWKTRRHLERHDSGRYHYPAVIQARDGTIHAVYTYTVDGGESMKHAAFSEAWLEENRSF
jgi:predicted neuraminidase